MAETPDPSSVAGPAPRRRRGWSAVLMLLLSLMLFGSGAMRRGATGHDACCAIECEFGDRVCLQREQLHAREHALRRKRAERDALGAFAGSAIALLAAGGLVFGRR